VTTNVEDVLSWALAQKGKRYILGVEVQTSDANPAAFDCSELVQWACARAAVVPAMPDGTWIQHAYCAKQGTMISVEDGIDTRGALLFNHRNRDGTPTDNMANCPPTAHVALSLGDGTTIEAMGTKWGTLVGNANGRNWTHAARIPGLDYTPQLQEHRRTTPRQPPVQRGKPWMKLRATGPDVRELQERLIRFGADRLPRHVGNGHFSELTDIAVRLVQEHVRANFDPTMDVDGQCGPITWGWVSKLAENAPAGSRPVLELEAPDSPAVAELQAALVTIGIRRLPTLTPTGDFGTLTDLAVRLFQLHIRTTRDPTMDVDGICGPVTWDWLVRLTNA
jgi:peptidoglycan hydrolase-like protein with peptidoglycan-binding domain